MIPTTLYLFWTSYSLGILKKIEFRKSTCKNDHIHFSSHHSNNIKRVVIIGFYLVALRICSQKYLNDEFNHVGIYSLNLLYLISFIHFAKSKVLKINNKYQARTNANSQSYIYSLLFQTILPLTSYCPVGCGCRIHRLHLCRGVWLPTMSVLDMTLNNLMMSFHWGWRFGECGVPLYYQCPQVHSGRNGSTW